MRAELTTYTVRVAYTVAIKQKIAFRAVNYLHMRRSEGRDREWELQAKVRFDVLMVRL
jgi:hypothetical protein